MTASQRMRLRDLVERVILDPEAAGWEARAYATAADLVATALLHRYPPDDMAVLRRYDVARRDACISVEKAAGGMTQFRFNKEEAPWVPDRRITVQVDEAATTAVEAWERACARHVEALTAKRKDYYALIYGAKTVEDVVDVWPEAASVIEGALMTCVTPEVVDRIRRDVAARQPETIS